MNSCSTHGIFFSLQPSALADVYAHLFRFAQADAFWANWQTAFGSDYDVIKAAQIRQRWANRNFAELPTIEIQPQVVLGTAQGAYVQSANKIYISASFLKTASRQAVTAVILEEIGHYIDAQINRLDSAGDEGAIFAALIQGSHLDQATLSALRGENDQATIILDGKSIQVEKADITGTSGNDSIIGTALEDNLSGLEGNDTIRGLGGNDTLSGGDGNDNLDSGADDDELAADAGNDTINGGSGNDRYVADFGGASSGLTMTYNPATGSGTFSVGTELDTFTSIESFEGLKGTEFNDVMFGGSLGEWWEGLSGGSGDDTISGNAGNDQVFGEEGNDVLNGGVGNDQLFGGDGNDSLQGATSSSGGSDELTGGTGNDLFILADAITTFYDDGSSTSGGESDYAFLHDFSTVNDRIQLRGSSGDYLLSLDGINTKLFINKPMTEPDELIAIIYGQSGLNLTASYFSYLSGPALPAISLAVSPSSVAEDGAANLIYTFTRSGPTTAVLTVNYTVAGTALLGTDYTGIAASPATKTVSFAAGSATATVTVDPTP
ncbi:MAG: calcium-binding protein, partial [Cyanobacteriota bacterium]